jgi:biotin carboxyl carrier protein
VEYELKINQKKVHAEADSQEDRRLQISIGKNRDKNVYDVRYNIISDHRILMTVNHNGHTRQVNAYISNSLKEKTVTINGRYYLITDLEAQGEKARKGHTPDMPDLITPPTPAVVVKIHVQTGEQVEKGQAVIAVSAMKMETTLCAPYDGTVSKINTAINDKVAPGQILVEIEKTGNTTLE